jgi:lipoprotein-anchoring transpeptidase ErfK/SrfK
MRRRAFTWFLLAALAVSLHLAGTADAQAQFWGPYYRNSWGDFHGYRYKPQRGYTKPESIRKTRPEKAGKDAKLPSKDTAKGPLLIVISIADQRISLYDNGELVARSTVSTGVRDHPTPLGVFSVISKSKFHRSNIYSNAPMPFMQRITWSGIALHAGELPGYPASHGCIRLTHDFATRLFHLTKRGTRVIIAHDDIRPSEISNPQLFVPKPKVALASPPPATATQPTITADATDAPPIPNIMRAQNAKDEVKAPDPVSTATTPQKGAAITVFVSRKLSKLYVRQGFAPLFDSPVKIQDAAEPMGTHVFTAMEFQNDGAAIRWTVVTVPERSAHSHSAPVKEHKGRAKQVIRTIPPTPANASAALNRIEIPQDAVQRISELLTPGSSLIISDYGISGETGVDTDFIVLTR